MLHLSRENVSLETCFDRYQKDEDVAELTDDYSSDEDCFEMDEDWIADMHNCANFVIKFI